MFRAKPGEAYRPSNGTEGEGFHESYCYQCLHTNPDPEGEKQCQIWMKALCYNTNEPEYPKEWTYDDQGKPTCTNHVKWDWNRDGDPDDPNNPNQPPLPPDPNQLSLFPMYPDERDFQEKTDRKEAFYG